MEDVDTLSYPTWDCKYHDVAHGIVVPGLAVDPQPHLDLMRVRDLVPGRDAGPNRGEGVKRLAELLA
jgi:hypothetical protein